MFACMLPAFTLVSFADEGGENINGLNAKLYQLKALSTVMPYSGDRYYHIVGTTTNRDPWCRFDDTVRFENALPTLLFTSKIDPAHTATGLTGLDGIFGADGYLMKWEGTVTAATAGDYTMVGRKIDNGFLAFVDQNGDGEFTSDEKFYDYASPNHWFDGGEDRLVSQQGAFHLEAGVATAIQMWYYEAGGGEACVINVSTEGGANDKSFGDAGFTFNLDRTVYTSDLAVNHDRIYEIIPNGARGGACDGLCNFNHSNVGDGNCSDCNDEANHKYADTIDALKAQMFYLGEKVLPTFETAGFSGLGYTGYQDEDSLIEYTGFITPATTGTYQFGTKKVDNCLIIEIQIDGEWVNVYEFWAGRVWNDRTTTYSNTTVDLTAGTSYPIRISYLEIDGGQAIEALVKIDGTESVFAASGLKLTTEAIDEIPEITTQYFFNTASEWYYMTSGYTDEDFPADDWMTNAEVYGTWETANADLGEHGSNVWDTSKDESVIGNKGIWAVKEFTVEDIEAIADWSLMTSMFFDDNIHLYINGKEVFTHGTWNNGLELYKFVDEAGSVLKEGTNVIAAHLWQGHGGYAFDMSLYATADDTSNFAPTYTPPVESTLTLEDGQDYQLYTQTRVNANDATATDYRVIIVAKQEWLTDNYDKGFVISFTDGTTAKTLDVVPTTYYRNILAQNAEGANDLYVAAEGTAIVGWVVTGVPAGFSATMTVGDATFTE